MPPQRLPPALTDDLVGEILLRLPPDDPASLFRASVVCKPWRDLLYEPGFFRRYRASHHGSAPVLGFVHNSGFISTTTASSQLIPPAFNSNNAIALDCRHGRVLLHTLDPTEPVIWDPITGNLQRLPDVPDGPYNHITGAVFCAVDGCDHIDCRGGPFVVVFAATADDDALEEEEEEDSVTWISVYSSETGAWSAPATIHLGPISSSSDMMGASLLAGGTLYFLLEDGRRILKYELRSRELSVMTNMPPLRVGNMALVKAEEGGLGVAGVQGYSLHLWSWRGAAGWVQARAIELDMMLSMDLGDPSTDLRVIGFSESANAIFINANSGVFAVDLKSDRVRKIYESGYFGNIVAYASFYTPDYARGRLEPPVRMQYGHMT